MTRRADLNEVLGRAKASTTSPTQQSDEKALNDRDKAATAGTVSTPQKRSTAEPAAKALAKGKGRVSNGGNHRGGPLFSSLERKETRLRVGQVEDLTTHARRVNRAKTEAGERITENTLIRVAIDMLLARADDLHGNNEHELRKSVGL